METCYDFTEVELAASIALNPTGHISALDRQKAEDICTNFKTLEHCFETSWERFFTLSCPDINFLQTKSSGIDSTRVNITTFNDMFLEVRCWYLTIFLEQFCQYNQLRYEKMTQFIQQYLDNTLMWRSHYSAAFYEKHFKNNSFHILADAFLILRQMSLLYLRCLVSETQKMCEGITYFLQQVQACHKSLFAYDTPSMSSVFGQDHIYYFSLIQFFCYFWTAFDEDIIQLPYQNLSNTYITQVKDCLRQSIMPQVIQFLFQALRDLATFWENIKLCHVQLDNVTFYGVSELVLVTSKMIHWVDIQLFATVEKVETLFQLIRFDTRCRISVLQWLKAFYMKPMNSLEKIIITSQLHFLDGLFLYSKQPLDSRQSVSSFSSISTQTFDWTYFQDEEINYLSELVNIVGIQFLTSQKDVYNTLVKTTATKDYAKSTHSTRSLNLPKTSQDFRHIQQHIFQLISTILLFAKCMYNSPMETVVENVLPFLSDYIKCIKKDANAVTEEHFFMSSQDIPEFLTSLVQQAWQHIQVFYPLNDEYDDMHNSESSQHICNKIMTSILKPARVLNEILVLTIALNHIKNLCKTFQGTITSFDNCKMVSAILFVLMKIFEETKDRQSKESEAILAECICDIISFESISNSDCCTVQQAMYHLINSCASFLFRKSVKKYNDKIVESVLKMLMVTKISCHDAFYPKTNSLRIKALFRFIRTNVLECSHYTVDLVSLLENSGYLDVNYVPYDKLKPVDCCCDVVKSPFKKIPFCFTLYTTTWTLEDQCTCFEMISVLLSSKLFDTSTTSLCEALTLPSILECCMKKLLCPLFEISNDTESLNGLLQKDWIGFCFYITRVLISLHCLLKHLFKERLQSLLHAMNDCLRLMLKIIQYVGSMACIRHVIIRLMRYFQKQFTCADLPQYYYLFVEFVNITCCCWKQSITSTQLLLEHVDDCIPSYSFLANHFEVPNSCEICQILILLKEYILCHQTEELHKWLYVTQKDYLDAVTNSNIISSESKELVVDTLPFVLRILSQCFIYKQWLYITANVTDQEKNDVEENFYAILYLLSETLPHIFIQLYQFPTCLTINKISFWLTDGSTSVTSMCSPLYITSYLRIWKNVYMYILKQPLYENILQRDSILFDQFSLKQVTSFVLNHLLKLQFKSVNDQTMLNESLDFFNVFHVTNISKNNLALHKDEKIKGLPWPLESLKTIFLTFHTCATCSSDRLATIFLCIFNEQNTSGTRRDCLYNWIIPHALSCSEEKF